MGSVMALPTRSYVSPGLCCRCGQRRGEALWEFKSAQLKAKYRLVYLETETITQTFTAPVCKECRAALESFYRKNARRVNGSIVVFVLSSAACRFLIRPFFAGDDGGTPQAWLLVSAGLGWLLGLATGLVIRDRSEDEIATFDGVHFKFKNAAFRREFSKLNPGLLSEL